MLEIHLFSLTVVFMYCHAEWGCLTDPRVAMPINTTEQIVASRSCCRQVEVSRVPISTNMLYGFWVQGLFGNSGGKFFKDEHYHSLRSETSCCCHQSDMVFRDTPALCIFHGFSNEGKEVNLLYHISPI